MTAINSVKTDVEMENLIKKIKQGDSNEIILEIMKGDIIYTGSSYYVWDEASILWLNDPAKVRLLITNKLLKMLDCLSDPDVNLQYTILIKNLNLDGFLENSKEILFDSEFMKKKNPRGLVPLADGTVVNYKDIKRKRRKDDFFTACMGVPPRH